MTIDFSQWDNSQVPEDEDINFEWRIIRCKTKAPLRFACISAGYYGCYAHFVLNRTYPHLLTDCVHCKKGNLKRWGGYILGLERDSKSKIIAHFPKTTCKRIIDLQRDNKGTLRGLALEFYRATGDDHGPVGVRELKLNVREADLPPPQAIRPLCARIWGFNDDASLAPSNVNDNNMQGSDRVEYERRIIVPSTSLPINEDGESITFARVTAEQFAARMTDGLNGRDHQ